MVNLRRPLRRLVRIFLSVGIAAAVIGAVASPAYAGTTKSCSVNSKLPLGILSLKCNTGWVGLDHNYQYDFVHYRFTTNPACDVTYQVVRAYVGPTGLIYYSTVASGVATSRSGYVTMPTSQTIGVELRIQVGLFSDCSGWASITSNA